MSVHLSGVSSATQTLILLKNEDEEEEEERILDLFSATSLIASLFQLERSEREKENPRLGRTIGACGTDSAAPLLLPAICWCRSA